jgi:hypothetical protein
MIKWKHRKVAIEYRNALNSTNREKCERLQEQLRFQIIFERACSMHNSEVLQKHLNPPGHLPTLAMYQGPLGEG